MSWDEVQKFDDDYPLSPSAIKTYMRCPKQFEFAYIKGMKRPPNLKMVFGSSVHKGLETNYAHKFLKKRDLKVSDVQDAFVTDIRTRVKKEGVAATKAEIGASVDEGTLIIAKYQADVAPHVQPVMAPEIELIAAVPGAKRKLRGFIDLVADVRTKFTFGESGWKKNVLRDTKTTARMYTQEQADTDIQLTIYAYLLKVVKKIIPTRVQFDVIVRKRPQAECKTVSSDRGQEHFKRMEDQFKGIEASIRAGVFYPTDNHQTCSWCGYAALCHKGRAWATPQ